MRKKFQYYINCMRARGSGINQMMDEAKEITLKTIRKHCDIYDFEKELGYATGNQKGLRLSGNWHVGYYKSKYKDKPCYIIRHGAIEYIWIQLSE